MTTNNTNRIVIKALIITWFLLMTSVGVFAQSSKAVAVEVPTTETVNVTESNSTMLNWFMGTRQTPKATINDAGASSKKQMINSGVEPNRILMKAFLKKASEYQSTVA